MKIWLIDTAKNKWKVAAMRVKTDKRRAQLLLYAATVFAERGYDGASMEEIAARAGASKATLYRYFDSKESLFAITMVEQVARQANEVAAMIDRKTRDPLGSLTAFARAYLDFVLAPHSLAIVKTLAAQPEGSLASELYNAGPRSGWNEIAEHLRTWSDRGLLRAAPPLTMALHLKGLLEAGVLEPALFGAPAAMPREEAAALAVDAFLRAYRAS